MNPDGRVLAVDYGEKRIGIALSDPMRMFAKPLCVLPNNGYEEMVNDLMRLIDTHEVKLLIFGIPYAIDGGNTPKTDECEAVFTRLKTDLNLPVQGYDERYSTCEADTELKKLGYTWQEARKVKDAMAACMFLKEYLNQ